MFKKFQPYFQPIFIRQFRYSREFSSYRNLQTMDVVIIQRKNQLKSPFSQTIFDYLNKTIDKKRFALHHITDQEMFKVPWTKNAKMAISALDNLSDSENNFFAEFTDMGGYVLDITKFCNSSESVTLADLGAKLKQVGVSETLIGENCTQLPGYTDGFLLGSTESWVKINQLTSSKMTVTFGNAQTKPANSDYSTSDRLKLILDGAVNGFDYILFSSRLKNLFERNNLHIKTPLIAFVPVLDSTMDVAQVFSSSGIHSIVTVADVQLKGRGRRKNVWISNKGCAMMSFSFELKNCSQPSTIQLLAAMAVVRGIRSLTPKSVKLPLGIKWPNDVYLGGKTKIAGVLVTAEFGSDGQMKFLAGIGVNLDNEAPTVSLNDSIITLSHHPNQLDVMKREDLLASIYFYCFQYIQQLSEKGFNDELIEEYCGMWMHDRQKVTYVDSSTNRLSTVRLEGIVRSVDSEGFLLVEPLGERVSGQKVIRLHPDGNSFDLTENLLYPNVCT